MIRIAIFASGAGSNAQKIIDYFRYSPEYQMDASDKETEKNEEKTANPAFLEGDRPAQLPAKEVSGSGLNAGSPHTGSQIKKNIAVTLIVCNKPGAGVLNIAKNEKIATLIIEKEKFFRGNAYVDELKEKNIDFIILAGFLWKIPDQLIKAFPRAIINIHPALLPRYGGKGMYGSLVHEAVLQAKETTSGITIHYVDEHYDHGDIIFQAKCSVNEADTPQSLAEKIHLLEHAHYPQVIEKEINRQLSKFSDH